MFLAPFLLFCCLTAPSSSPSLTPQRIVSLAPSLTELVYALGEGSRIVGVTRFDDYPESVKKLPRIGGFTDFEPEAILSLKPELVLAVSLQSNITQIETLRRLGIRVMVIPGVLFDDLWKSIDLLGRVLGVENKSQQLTQQLRQNFQALQQKHQHLKSLRTIMVVGHHPLVVAGPQSFLSVLIPHVKLNNAVTRGGSFPVLDLEALLRLDPDVIVDLGMDLHTRSEVDFFWQRITTLRAVKMKHVVIFQDSGLMRLGPRLVPSSQKLSTHVRSSFETR